MKLKLSRKDFLARWRSMRGYAPLRDDVDMARGDGLDFDMLLEAEMDCWYQRLLREGEVRLLAPEELAPALAMPSPADGAVTLTLPPGVVRVVVVRLSGWMRPAEIVTDPGCNKAMRQLHPYTRACAENPVAVLHPDGRLALYPASASDRLVSLQCVISRDDEFAMDSAALGGVSEFND